MQRTLQYQSHVMTRKLLWMPIVCLAIGLWVMLYGDVRDKMHLAPWIGLVVGAGWLIYAFYRLIVPAPPMLVLSPKGLIWRNGFNSLIPWQVVRDVTVIDHVVNLRRASQTFKDVTVVWVPRRFYNQKIFVPSLLRRGPFWGNVFIHKPDATGIVIVAELVSTPAKKLTEEVIARWRTFGRPPASESFAATVAQSGASRTSVPATHEYGVKLGGPVELADDAETRTVGYWVAWSLIFIGPLVASGLIYLIVSATHRSPQQDWAKGERERIELNRKVEQIWEDASRESYESRLQWRERSPWMFADDLGFTEPGTTPPQRPGSVKGHRAGVTWLAVARDGRTFLSASGDGTIKLWDMQKSEPLRDVGLHGGSARSVYFLPGGDRLLSVGSDGQIVIRALADGEVLHRLDARAHGEMGKLVLSADGRRALTVHQRGVVAVWDLEARTLIKAIKDTGAYDLGISPDGTQAVIGTHEGKLLVWDIDKDAEPRQIGTHEHGIYAVAFMPDGKHVVSGGGGDFALRLRNVATGEEVRSFAGHRAITYELAVSADGTRLVSGSHDGTSRLWNAETGERLVELDHLNVVRAAAFLADGTILTAGDDRSIRLWSIHGYREREFPGLRDN